MKRRVALVLLLTPVLTAPAFAGIFFNNKKPDKPNPADRVPELIKIVQTDGDEDKRIAAAEELRDYDPAQFPDMAPALIDVLIDGQEARRAGRGGPESRQAPARLGSGGRRAGAGAGQGFLDARAAAGPQRPAAIPLERLEGTGAEEGRDTDGPAEGAADQREQRAAAGPRRCRRRRRWRRLPTTPPPSAPVPVALPAHEAQPLPQGPPLAPPGGGDGPVLNPPPG